jgi:hypothetical protein
MKIYYKYERILSKEVYIMKGLLRQMFYSRPLKKISRARPNSFTRWISGRGVYGKPRGKGR